jgi:hypothetical protein
VSIASEDIKAMVPEVPSGEDVSWCIEDARTLMSDAFLAADPPVTSARQDLVVKYLAAHFLILKLERGGLLHTTAGGASDSYISGSRSNTGLAMTRYGQQAVALDPTRTLATMDNASGGVAEIRVV